MLKPCPRFGPWEVNPARLFETNYILNSGNPEKPEKNHPVEPGWPFAPPNIDFRDGRVEAVFRLADRAGKLSLFARVAVNRLWQWHLARALKKAPVISVLLGGEPFPSPSCSIGSPPNS